MNNYKSTLTIVIGFIIIGQYFDSKIGLIIGTSVGIIGLLSEKLNDIIILSWNKLAELLSKIVPNLILSIVYYFFLFPLAVINKLGKNKNPLNLKNNKSSYFIHTKNTITPSSLEKTW
jgi:hypothetical protein